MKKLSLIIQGLSSLIFAVFVFFFTWKSHPELLSFHEQNQMFLFVSDYFQERIGLAGGLADYVSEFLVQFFFYGSAGAAIVALVLVLMQILTCRALRTISQSWSVAPVVMSWIVTLLMGLHMMDENTLLSFPIAIIFSLGAYLLCRRGGWLCQLLVSLPLFWLVGPAFIIQVALAMAESWKQKSWKTALLPTCALLLTAGVWVYACRMLWVAQYPWDTYLAGINYHRLTIMSMEAPSLQNVILVAISTFALVLPLLQLTEQKLSKLKHLDLTTAIAFACIYGAFFIAPNISNNHHDKNTHVILEQLYQMRKGDWNGIIAKAEEYKKEKLPALESPLSCTAVNLSLAKTNQLSTRMFDFPQAGIQGLIMPRVRDNVSNVTSMEVFWQLGFINESLRYAFDSQESIANCRKSSRYTKRMAECNILNGRYDVASKYLDLLKKTLFYDKWAEQAETYLYNEDKIKGFPEWNQKLQCRLENDFLYYYPEMPKMLGQLVLRNRDNYLAYDYFMASLLLTGDTRSYVANLPPQNRQNQDPFPRGYQQYIEYMKAHAATDAVTGASY